MFVVALWCLIFAAVHIYWALGGSTGLAESAGADLAEQRPAIFVIFGLWGVSAVLLAVGCLVIQLDPARWPRSWRRLSVGAVAVVAVLLLLRGIALEAVLLLDVGGVASSVGPAETTWSLLGWNPWFVLGGVGFLALARAWHRTGRHVGGQREPREP